MSDPAASDAVVTPVDLHRELGLHEHVVRSHLREWFAEPPEDVEHDDLTREEADDFLAWHANRYGTTGLE